MPKWVDTERPTPTWALFVEVLKSPYKVTHIVLTKECGSLYRVMSDRPDFFVELSASARYTVNSHFSFL